MKLGLTLIELLIVVSVIAFLSLLSLFAIGNKIKQARDADRRTDIYEIRLGLEQYFINQVRYPDSLVFNTQPLASPDGQQIFLPRVHHDPLNRDPYLYIYNATPAGMANSYDLCAYRLETSAGGAWCLHNLQ